MRYRRYGLLLGLALALSACSPEIHEMHKQPDEWKRLDIGTQKTNGAHKPFGCDSRDLATFTCD